MPIVRRKPPPFHNQGRCRWCDAEVTGRRKSWCSQKCVNEYLATDPGRIRKAVFHRDRGVCAHCGRACAALQQKIRFRLMRRDVGAMRLVRILQALRIKTKSNWFDVQTLWEADHIVPVVEGGGHEMANLRTLCVVCHKRETRALLARLKARRVA